MKFTIQKGDSFKCKKDVVMIDDFGNSEGTAYYKGRKYKSEKDLCITDEFGYKDHFWDELNEFNKYFKYLD